LLLFFACTLFVSATLLFLVQPMIGKMVLPSLGGTPAVWNTCMVFFQGVLLVGYAYTHTLSTQSRRRQLLAQFVILALPVLVLPFSLGNWTPPADQNPAQSVLWLLLGMVGLPFFVVATSAPLLQRWFSATGHPAAKDPYFLYGASNLGSMLALLLYPVFIEPNFDLDAQSWLWTLGYACLVVMVAGCGLIVWKETEPAKPMLAAAAGGEVAVSTKAAAGNGSTAIQAGAPGATALEKKSASQFVTSAPPSALKATKRLGRHRTATPLGLQAPENGPQNSARLAIGRPASNEVTLRRRLRWIGLAAAPTSLMLGVTTYLTTDIAAIPFIWIVPLALYLLTFILVFARWPVPWVGMPHTIMLYVQPFFLMILVLMTIVSLENIPVWVTFAVHLVAFFTTALVCHGELAKDRPAARQLTDFYLCMSLGGVLGGMFNALVAPQFFWFGVAEYYLAMVLASCLRPQLLSNSVLIPGDTTEEEATPLGRALDWMIPIAIGFLAFFLAKAGRQVHLQSYFLAAAAVLVLALAGRPLRFGLSLGCLIFGVMLFDRTLYPYLFEGRSFFGFVKVREENDELKFHTLIHGGINHGMQIVEPVSRRRDTITYFDPTGGIGQIFKKFSWSDARLPASLVGLGALANTSGWCFPGDIVAAMHSEPPYAVVGLGTGILAAHAKPWQHVVIYEIDPLVKRLSVPPEGEEPFFYFVQDARDRAANLEIVLGDGRLTLTKDPRVNPFDPKTNRKLERYYHIIVLDAFSSDAIPVHLLTAEAVDLYLDKLVDGGVLIFNVTNKYVDIRPVLGKIAEEKDLVCLYYGDGHRDEDGHEVPYKYASDWIVMQRKDYTRQRGKNANGGPALSERLNMNRWHPAEVLDGPMWTDKYSNLLGAMGWR
jgi:hypothetical protein